MGWYNIPSWANFWVFGGILVLDWFLGLLVSEFSGSEVPQCAFLEWFWIPVEGGVFYGGLGTFGVCGFMLWWVWWVCADFACFCGFDGAAGCFAVCFCGFD